MSLVDPSLTQPYPDIASAATDGGDLHELNVGRPPAKSNRVVILNPL
jgi:hypothetical protein